MIHGLNNGQILAGLSVGLLGWRTRGSATVAVAVARGAVAAATPPPQRHRQSQCGAVLWRRRSRRHSATRHSH